MHQSSGGSYAVFAEEYERGPGTGRCDSVFDSVLWLQCATDSRHKGTPDSKHVHGRAVLCWQAPQQRWQVRVLPVTTPNPQELIWPSGRSLLQLVGGWRRLPKIEWGLDHSWTFLHSHSISGKICLKNTLFGKGVMVRASNLPHLWQRLAGDGVAGATGRESLQLTDMFGRQVLRFSICVNCSWCFNLKWERGSLSLSFYDSQSVESAWLSTWRRITQLRAIWQ